MFRRVNLIYIVPPSSFRGLSPSDSLNLGRHTYFGIITNLLYYMAKGGQVGQGNQVSSHVSHQVVKDGLA